MVTNLLFASLFAINVGVILYLSIDERMHAQPGRLLALAFIALIVTFMVQTSFDSMAAALDAFVPGKRRFEDIKLSLSLVNTVVGAFAGALIGTAVSNRAMHLNSKKNKELNARAERNKMILAEADKIKEELTNPSTMLTHEEFISNHKQREILLTKYIFELHDIRDEERKLSL